MTFIAWESRSWQSDLDGTLLQEADILRLSQSAALTHLPDQAPHVNQPCNFELRIVIQEALP